MQELVANLRLAMKETIEGLDWMGPETKKKALEKLSTFNPKVGYPDKWLDYSHGADPPRLLLGRRRGRAQVQRRMTDRSHHRQAHRPRPLGHDPAHLRRLLQPAA